MWVALVPHDAILECANSRMLFKHNNRGGRTMQASGAGEGGMSKNEGGRGGETTTAGVWEIVLRCLVDCSMRRLISLKSVWFFLAEETKRSVLLPTIPMAEEMKNRRESKDSDSFLEIISVDASD